MEGFSKISQLEPDEYYKSPEGFIVFTEKYLLKRGYCCQNGCKHCPYGFSMKSKKQSNTNNKANDTNQK